MEGRLGLTWGLSSIHGWGVFGLNLVRQLLAHTETGWPRPLLLAETAIDFIHIDDHDMLAPLLAERDRLMDRTGHMKQVGLQDTLVLHSSGNGLVHSETSARYRGVRNVGFTFYEETNIPVPAIDAAKTLDGMRTGSNWNRDHLIQLGFQDVVCVHQGIDTEIFTPRPKSERYKNHFVIFSGGKLEFRKGQDIVLAAFKAFHARHPDALLLSVWQNPWLESIATLLESPHTSYLPETNIDPTDAMTAWSRAEGVPDGAHIDAGVVTNTALPDVLADADVAVFANRCEGGTNLAAMECMASGIPCVMSMNTGHLDIATPENCYPLVRQSPVIDSAGRRAGWGNSDVDEIVDHLEAIYTDRATARIRAEQAVVDMREMNWETQTGKLIDSFR